MQHDFAHEVNIAAAKSAPAIGVAAAAASGWSVQEWMYAATIGYIVMQAAYLGWKWYREWRKGNR